MGTTANLIAATASLAPPTRNTRHYEGPRGWAEDTAGATMRQVGDRLRIYFPTRAPFV